MTDEEEKFYFTPIVMQEVPDQCDTCGASSENLDPVTQTRKAGPEAFAKEVSMVIGYFCKECQTGHLYQR